MTTIIHAYTRNDALEDGVLTRLGDYFAKQALGGFFLDGLRQTQETSARFDLGELVITKTAASALRPKEVLIALLRHRTGDWGDVCDEDRQANDKALEDGTRLFSVYTGGDDTRFYVITEWNREATTVLLPEDY